MDSLVGVEIQGDDPSVLCKTGSLWGLGVAASLIASLAYTGGFLLQKKAHIQEEHKPEHARAKSCAGLVCSSRWLIGLLMVVLVSVPFDFVAFTEAGEALAAPLKGFAIVMNQAVAPWMLGETLQFWDYISTVLVVIGCTITTIFGPHNCGPDYGVKDLFGLMKAPPFIVAESILGFLALLTMLVVWRRQFRVDYAWVNALGEKFECPFLAFFAGAMGVQVNILMKCVGSMVADDIAGHKDQTRPNYTQYFFWVSAGLGLFFVLFQLSIINQGLAVFEAVKFMPMMVVIFILGCSVVGGVYYQEFNGFEITDWVMFPLGCMIILAGVLLLTLTEDKAKRLYSIDSMPCLDDEAGYRREVLHGRLSLQESPDLYVVLPATDEALLDPNADPGPIL